MSSVRIAIHVTPKSNRDEIAGWRGGELSVRVTAPPEGGKANAAVCRVVGKSLGVPKSAVKVLRGDASRHKQIEVAGITDADVLRTFGEPDPGLF